MVDGTLGRSHFQTQPPPPLQPLPSQQKDESQQGGVEPGLFRKMSAQGSFGHPDEHKKIANYASRLAASRTLPVQV